MRFLSLVVLLSTGQILLTLLGCVQAFSPPTAARTRSSVSRHPAWTKSERQRQQPQQWNLDASPFHVVVSSRRIRSTTGTALNMMPPLVDDITTTLPSLVTAVHFFDGGSVVDPVVVSNAFWDGISRQFISLIIGNVLAVIGFGFITTFASAKMTEMGNFASEQIFGDTNKSKKTAAVLKQPPPGYTGGDASARIKPNFNKLFVCIIIDMIGTSSEMIPFVGGLTDIVWAPIAALLLKSLYGSNVVFALEFAEEALLFTDILPLATICWVVDTFFYDSDIAKILQIGSFRPEQSQKQQQKQPPPPPEVRVTIERPQQYSSIKDVVSKNAVSGNWRQLTVDNADELVMK